MNIFCSRNIFYVFALPLALLTGCTVSSTPAATLAPRPIPPVSSPSPVASPRSPAHSARTQILTSRSLGLIPPTDPEQRYREIRRGHHRSDPFRVDQPTPKPPSQNERPSEQASAVPLASRPNPETEKPSPSPASTMPATPAVPPGPLGVQAPLPQIAPPSVPLLSTAVKVLGVAQIGDRPAAIIASLSEPGPRYVYEQDRLDGGIVLVQRIDASAGVVTFSENGLEISRRVGQEPISMTPAPVTLPAPTPDTKPPKPVREASETPAPTIPAPPEPLGN